MPAQDEFVLEILKDVGLVSQEDLSEAKHHAEADGSSAVDKLIEMEVTISGKGYVIRGQTAGVEGKVFQACGIALQPVLRQC